MPTLGVRALLGKLLELAPGHGLRNARVATKVNAAGELVIALIVPPEYVDHWKDLASPRGGRPRKYQPAR